MLIDFARKVEASWHPNRRKINVICEKLIFEKSSFFQWKNTYFQGSGGPRWQPKSIKNRSKFEVQLRVPLGIDFSSILVDFGGQVGFQNPPKIDQKWHRKNDEKRSATRWPPGRFCGDPGAQHEGRDPRRVLDFRSLNK